MNQPPLSIAILWHMHQPFYKDLVTGEYVLPWVRLHAVKDYYDMAAILDRFPQIKVTFNLVPSLLLQIEDYVNNKVNEKFLDLTMREPADLSLAERVFILQNFFMANWENMINPYPRYRDLLLKRGRFVSLAELEKVARRFSAQELLDLQVWFNLAWFGFVSKNEDPVIKELIQKGKYFTPEDKKLVIDKQFEIMRRVIPKYKELHARGQIELTTSAFYHPILPLLCDTNSAKEAMPYAKLPERVFAHPEDAQTQIRTALEFHEKQFGSKPQGMWPSEGAVSQQIIPLLAAEGIKWIATDEGILEKSLHQVEMRSHTLSAAQLCQPYLVEEVPAAVSVIFRNHFISDQIGFVYHRWKIKDALADFSSHLNNIRVSLPQDGRNYLLSIILDGENAWEYYAGGGKEFIEAFYTHLSDNPLIKTVQVGDYLAENPPTKKIAKLFAGSWINNDFKIWIGHAEDNLAWDYLNLARQALVGQQNKIAWEEIYIAQGSDWGWWFGDDHSSENDAVFDALFRKHLKNVYQLIGRNSPKYLDSPIKTTRLTRPLREPVYLIAPRLDGEITNYYEWLAAGHFDIARVRGAMHQIETVLREIYYGFSMTDLYLRMDVNIPLVRAEVQNFSFAVLSGSSVERKAEIAFNPDEGHFTCKLYQMTEGHAFEFIKEIESFGVRFIIEMGIPFSDLKVTPGQKLNFVVVIYKSGQEVERWPRGGGISVVVPTETYAEEQWYV